MIQPRLNQTGLAPALARLSRLAPLTSTDVGALEDAIKHSRLAKAGNELVSEGQEIGAPLLLVSGFAARDRLLADGRRQFLSFVLPGDLIGLHDHARPLAMATVVALTDVTVCAAPSAERSPTLKEAYAVSRALDEAYLLNQVVRLGRLTALERVADMLLELCERLELSGLATQDRFSLPLTQEVLADALGLTAVHINRMLRQLREDGSLTWKGGRAALHNRAFLGDQIGRTSVRVSALHRD